MRGQLTARDQNSPRCPKPSPSSTASPPLPPLDKRTPLSGRVERGRMAGASGPDGLSAKVHWLGLARPRDGPSRCGGGAQTERTGRATRVARRWAGVARGVPGVCPLMGRSVPAGTPRAGGWPADPTDAGRFARRARVAGHLKRLGESGPRDPCAGTWARTGARLAREGPQRARGQASMAPEPAGSTRTTSNRPATIAGRCGSLSKGLQLPHVRALSARWGANGG